MASRNSASNRVVASFVLALDSSHKNQSIQNSQMANESATLGERCDGFVLNTVAMA